MADTDDTILATAKTRFERCVQHYSKGREKARSDIRFAAASPDDPWQWDDRQVKERQNQQRPCLTINKMPQHIRQVTNDIRQNRPSIRFRPADNEADPEVADILMGVVRHIEANSDADIAYDTAAEHQVTAGEGYIRVLADYVREDSFDQDIFIKRVKNPFRIYLDPDIQDPAGADARYAFVEDLIDEDEFKTQYPDAEAIDWNAVAGKDDWYGADKKVRVCEYFEVTEKQAKLYRWENGKTSFEGDKMPEGVMKGERPTKERMSAKRVVMWRKLTGNQILERKEFPCRYIPIARVVGNEWEVDGDIITSGIVRNAKDSQRMYNVAQSAIVERVMQAPKAPWAAPAAAVQGYETVWQTANTANHSFLPYNHVDELGQPIPSPVRVAPASVEPGLTEVARAAAEDIKTETGQYDASLGSKSNETSGRAIMARQREGDTSTYHYVDNLARAVRHVGRIILDMYPKVYDTKRVALIIGEDDSSTSAILDPDHPEALSEGQNPETGEIERTFNPFVGTYDVYATSGPSFTTRRVEAVQAMTEMTQASPQLWGVIGDQLVKNMDWPGADEMAKRLKATLIPPVQQMLQGEEKGQGQIPPQLQMAMQQMQQKMQEMEQQNQELQKAADANQAKVHVAQLQADTTMAQIQSAERIAQLSHGTKAQSDMQKEGMKGDQAAMGEQARQQTALAVAQLNAENRIDVASIAALTQLELAAMQPTPALEDEMKEGD